MNRGKELDEDTVHERPKHKIEVTLPQIMCHLSDTQLLFIEKLAELAAQKLEKLRDSDEIAYKKMLRK
jgi:hypothetical protein